MSQSPLHEYTQRVELGSFKMLLKYHKVDFDKYLTNQKNMFQYRFQSVNNVVLPVVRQQFAHSHEIKYETNNNKQKTIDTPVKQEPWSREGVCNSSVAVLLLGSLEIL